MLIVKEMILKEAEVVELVKVISRKINPKVESIGYIPEAGYMFGRDLAMYLDVALVNLNKVKRQLNNLVIVDCICDTGKTMAEYAKRFKHIQTVSLVNRLRQDKVFTPDVIGLEYDKDYFLLGYGLDYKGKWRQLSFIVGCVLEKCESFYTKGGRNG